ncbi:MAG TPA: hypothetical protein VI583_14930 [Cyclobacteriaceae bacterium]|nr:hypothetical protein [Cyclobacteriaceae bacterium]
MFSLYHVGYYLIYASLKQQRDIFWESKLENNDLSGTEIFQHSLPITFPYQPNQEDLLNLKLEHQADGQVYRVLKYRYEKDTLHLTYIKDIKEEGLNRSFSDWALTFSQKPSAGKDGTKQLPAFEKNYLPCFECFCLQTPYCITLPLHPVYFGSLLTPDLEVPVPPPWHNQS